MKLLTSGLAFAAVLAASEAGAWTATEGKPYDGQVVRVLAVSSSQFQAYEARLAPFEEATGIDVQVDYIPFANMREALTAEMIAGGSDYDVVSVMDQWVVSLKNLLQPIGEGIAAQGTDLADYPAAHMRHGMIGSDLYAIPVRGHVQLMFYRKDLLATAGVEAPQTWADVLTASKAVQGSSEAAGIALPYGRLNGQNMMVWMNLLWGNGGNLFDADGKPVFNSDAGVAATQSYIDMLLVDKIAPAGSASFVEQDAINSFKQGNSAMLPVWWWVASQLTENIGYPLKLRGMDRAARDARVAEIAAKVELGALLKRRPSELSGGQRQRVALARAIVRTPKIFLMDEPLSNLDAKLRVTMRAELKHLHHELGVTTVYVTHDQMEAMTLATRVAVMRDGRIVQLDTPKKIYSEPIDLFVAGFIGSPSMNLINGAIRAGRFTAPGVDLPVTGADRDDVVLGIRPEDLELWPAEGAPMLGKLYALELTGDATLVTLRDRGTSICARGPADFDASIGSTCALAPKPGARIHLFDKTSGQRIDA